MKRDGDHQMANSSDQEPTKLVKQFDDQVAHFLLDKMLPPPPQQHHNDLLLQTTIINLPKSGEQGTRVTAKSKLQEICAVYKWKPPFFECCNQDGPPHCPLFSFKVTVEIGGEDETCLECFGAPGPKKITAAEHAAEGALWFLNHSGYLSIDKFKKKGKTPKP